MSRIVKIKSELKQNKNKAFLRSALFALLALAFLGLGVGVLFAISTEKSKLHIAVPIILLAIALVLFICFTVFRKRYKILLSGVKGENNTLDILKKLPKDFTVITNPVILNRGVSLELDFVVIGKNGVFIVESKNYRGIISGSTSKANWKQIKHGKNDKAYEKEVGNPVKQAHRQGRRMLEMFRDFDITADVFPIVYFVDSRSELKIQDDAKVGIPILNNEKQLLDYIVNTTGKETVNNTELAKIIRFFKR